MSKDRPRVMIVDDKAQNRMLFSEYLMELEVDIDEASSGEECLKALKEHMYSLVCLDVQMPGMDGYMVLEEMRRDDNLADIPVIFISAVFNSEEYILKGLSKGAIDYISKPVSVPILINKVSNFLNFYEKQKKLDQLVRRLESMNHRIRENQQKFKRITNSAKDSIIVLDNQFNIRFVNNSACSTFGYNKFEIISENFFEFLIAEKERQFLREQFRPLIQNQNEDFPNSVRCTGKNNYGSEFPIELSIASYLTAQEQTNYTVIIRDITHRVRMEKEALAAKELRESNKVMKEFMDNVSHELRTPMNGIMGISNMLLKYNAENLTAKQREGLEIISQSGARLLELINDILDLSRINANREKVVNERFDFDIFLAAIQSIVVSLIGEKEIKFLIRKSKSVPQFICSDQKKLNQILINLLGNSAKFTQKGKILLFIHYVGDHLYFEVSDTGIGIEEEHLESIFDRFHQIDNSASKSFKGTGLGLNITKKMVELMNGEIVAESQPGKGTVMKFYIPVSVEKSEENECVPVIKASGIDVLDNDELSKPLALIIDFETETQFLFSEILKVNGFNTVLCSQSQSVSAEIQKWHPDLIILRLEMPKMHGLSLIRSLKSRDEYKQIPVITYSMVEKINPESYGSPVLYIDGPITEKKILSCIKTIDFPNNRKSVSAMISLYEKENHLKSLKLSGEYFLNTSFQNALLYISRHEIDTLIFDGLDFQGQNFQLLSALNKIPGIIPKKVLAVSRKVFKPVMKELEKLPDFEVLDLSQITKIVDLA